MALKKTLAQRLLNITKISSQSHSNCRISSSSVQSRIPPAAGKSDIAPDPGDDAVFRRFLHKSAILSPELRSPPPASGEIRRQLREMDIARNRIRLDGLAPPPESTDVVRIEDARKLLRAAKLETVKSKLRKVPESCVSYSEFVRICEENCEDRDQAMKIAKMLDDSAAVIIVGDIVFLKPEQVNSYFSLIFQFSGCFFFFFLLCCVVNLWCVLFNL